VVEGRRDRESSKVIKKKSALTKVSQYFIRAPMTLDRIKLSKLDYVNVCMYVCMYVCIFHRGRGANNYISN
jgi:hypothetical protein